MNKKCGSEIVKPGKLDRRLIIQQKVNGSSNYGDIPISSWSEVATVWGGLGKQAGNEGYESDQIVALNQTQFTIRYRSDVNETMRIVYNSENYYIVNIREIGRKGGLLLVTERRDNES